MKAHRLFFAILLLAAGTLLLFSSCSKTDKHSSSNGLPVRVYVDGAYTGSSDGTSKHPYKKITDGMKHVGANGTVFAAGATYAESVSFPYKQNITLTQWQDRGTPSVTGDGANPAVSIIGASGAVLDGFDFSGGMIGVVVSDSEGVLIQGCQIIANIGAGVTANNSTLSLAGDTISGSTKVSAAKAGAAYGYGVQSQEGELSIDSCTIEQNEGAGIVADATKVSMVNSAVKNNGGYGIQIHNAALGDFNADSVSQNMGAGLLLDKCTGSILQSEVVGTGLLADESGEIFHARGVQIQSSSDINLQSDSFQGNLEAGVVFVGFSSGLVDQSQLSQNGQTQKADDPIGDGLAVWGNSGEVQVTGCAMDGNARCGVVFDHSSGSITGSEIKNNKCGLIVQVTDEVTGDDKNNTVEDNQEVNYYNDPDQRLVDVNIHNMTLVELMPTPETECETMVNLMYDCGGTLKGCSGNLLSRVETFDFLCAGGYHKCEDRIIGDMGHIVQCFIGCSQQFSADCFDWMACSQGCLPTGCSDKTWAQLNYSPSRDQWYLAFQVWTKSADQIFINGENIAQDYNLFNCTGTGECDYWWSSNNAECSIGNNNYVLTAEPSRPFTVTFHIMRGGKDYTYDATIADYQVIN